MTEEKKITEVHRYKYIPDKRFALDTEPIIIKEIIKFDSPLINGEGIIEPKDKKDDYTIINK